MRLLLLIIVLLGGCINEESYITKYYTQEELRNLHIGNGWATFENEEGDIKWIPQAKESDTRFWEKRGYKKIH